jgi:hypothetical protein
MRKVKIGLLIDFKKIHLQIFTLSQAEIKTVYIELEKQMTS